MNYIYQYKYISRRLADHAKRLETLESKMNERQTFPAADLVTDYIPVSIQ